MSNLIPWKMGTVETGKSCGYNRYNTFRVYIAKLLPMIPFGSPSSKSVALNKNCFCNANSCKPSISNSVTTRNYVDIPLANNSNLDEVLNGTSLKIEILKSAIFHLLVRF